MGVMSHRQSDLMVGSCRTRSDAPSLPRLPSEPTVTDRASDGKAARSDCVLALWRLGCDRKPLMRLFESAGCVQSWGGRG